mmetsp:Transcript_8197/g.22737  ORF Transcript_8197/g.22737 Transcript_8197/m.22737 type:complete len:349 (+) Transcript_8197:153-1199(+)
MNLFGSTVIYPAQPKIVGAQLHGAWFVPSLSMSLSLKNGPILFRQATFFQSWYTGKLDHGRWTAHKDLRILVVTLKHDMFLNHIRVDEPGAILPILFLISHPIDRVPNLQSILEFGRQIFQFLADQNVVGSLIGVQELDAGATVAVFGIQKDGLQNLQHGRNARAARHHANLRAGSFFQGFSQGFGGEFSATLVGQVSLGSLDENGLTNFERIQVLTQETAIGEFGQQGSVHFDDQFHFSQTRIIRHGRVRSHHGLAIGAGKLERNVLSNGQPQHVTFGQTQGVTTRVVRQYFFLDERQGLIVVKGQHLGWCGWTRQELVQVNDANETTNGGNGKDNEFLHIIDLVAR